MSWWARREGRQALGGGLRAGLARRRRRGRRGAVRGGLRVPLAPLSRARGRAGVYAQGGPGSRGARGLVRRAGGTGGSRRDRVLGPPLRAERRRVDDRRLPRRPLPRRPPRRPSPPLPATRPGPPPPSART